MTKRTYFSLPTVLAVAMLVAGCGSKSETEIASGTVTDPETGETSQYRVTTDDGGDESNISIKTKDGEVSFGGGTTNARLPDGFTPYPGTKMTGGFTSSTADGAGGMANFEVKGAAADVIAHFRKQAVAQGMKATSEMTAGDTVMFAAEKADDSKANIQLTATQSGDTVSGAVIYSLGK